MTGKAAFAALPVGKTVTVRKTVSESDVYLFAGLTGDLSPNHVDEEYMRKTKYGRPACSSSPTSAPTSSRSSPRAAPSGSGTGRAATST